MALCDSHSGSNWLSQALNGSLWLLLLLSNFAYTVLTILDWLLGTLLGSQRRCHADALYLSLELRMSYNLTCPAEEMVVGRLIFIGFGTTKYIAMPGQSLLMSDRH